MRHFHDPEKKKIFAQSAKIGFDMWEAYSKQKTWYSKKKLQKSKMVN